MKIVRFHATEDGGSHFDEVEVQISTPFTDEFGNVYHLANAFNSASVRIVELPDRLFQDWHNAPARQVVAVLSGTVEVTTTDGEVRRWSGGELFIADDVGGKGHQTSVPQGPARLLFIQLPDGFDVRRWSL